MMYRIVVACTGIPRSAGQAAAIDVAQEFQSRPWHQNVVCWWDGAKLLLLAENDFDPDGMALMDEFSDAIAATIDLPFDGQVLVEKVTFLGGNTEN